MTGWIGFALGALLVVAALFLLIGTYLRTGFGLLTDLFLSLVIAALLTGVIGGAAGGVLTLLRLAPTWPVAGVFGGVCTLLVVFFARSRVIGVVLGLIISIPAVVLAGSLGVIVVRLTAPGRGAPLPLLVLAATLLLLLFSFAWWLFGTKAEGLYKPLAPVPMYGVRTLTYGSPRGHRREFTHADLRTEPVDGSQRLRGWSGFSGWWRTRFFGFDARQLPINGRVWYPDGHGPFPLVLIVHGNHQMEVASDGGYAYLGERLASEGYVAVSIDQNFLNSSWSGDVGNDVLGRGWLLLEHLNSWQAWNDTTDHPFYRKVDLDYIHLIGHSRGGEAVAVAAFLNKSGHDPSDATLTTAQGFAIRSLVAISPTDATYRPGGHLLPIENLNYLMLWGSHDADIVGFQGSRAYQRVRFTDGGFHFKAGIYIQGANHGQFNTDWGAYDSAPPNRWLLDRRSLLPGAQQRAIAAGYISAFLQAAGDGGCVACPDIFTDAGVGAVPGVRKVHEDSTFRVLCDFEQGANARLATAAGASIDGEGLTLWGQQLVLLRTKESQLNHAVRLGWDWETKGKGHFEINLPTRLADDWQVTQHSGLAFSLAAMGDGAPPAPFTVELMDVDGNAARVSVEKVPVRLAVILHKVPWLDRRLFRQAETVFERTVITMAQFATDNPSFRPSKLIRVRFAFDMAPQGQILLDDIGMRIGWNPEQTYDD